MNELDVAGVLHTYAEKASKATNTKLLRKILRDLKEDLDLRKVRMEDKPSRTGVKPWNSN